MRGQRSVVFLSRSTRFLVALDELAENRRMLLWLLLLLLKLR